jgi:hypothetical protein
MNRLLAAGVVVTSLVTASTALAGQKGVPQFILTRNTDGSGSVQGQMASVRSSADTAGYLSATVYNYQSGDGDRYGYVQVRDAGGAYGGCYTYDAALLDVMARVQGDEFLYVQWDTYARCTMVMVGHGSQLAPKTP